MEKWRERTMNYRIEFQTACHRCGNIRAFAIPGLATLAIGREINDNLQLPEYDFRSFQHH